YYKIAKNNVATEIDNMRDRLTSSAERPTQPPRGLAKERPDQKHMTAKPLASMQFDDTDQVRVGGSPNADGSKKSDKALPMTGSNVTSPLPARSQEQSATQPSAEWQAPEKDNQETGTNLSSSGQLAQGQDFQISLGGVIGGTIVDPSGVGVSNAKVTMSGP